MSMYFVKIVSFPYYSLDDWRDTSSSSYFQFWFLFHIKLRQQFWIGVLKFFFDFVHFFVCYSITFGSLWIKKSIIRYYIYHVLADAIWNWFGVSFFRCCYWCLVFFIRSYKWIIHKKLIQVNLSWWFWCCLTFLHTTNTLKSTWSILVLSCEMSNMKIQ